MQELLPTRTASLAQRIAMYNGNALKIGVFGANCSSARTATTVPERWSASWPDCLAMARLADDAGIDFMLPIGRWKGYGGATDFHGSTLETVTWACGLLAATRRITVFGTVHAPLFHPLIAAKEFVTADHIGEGRFGLNIVAGWNEGEFEMFGVKQRDHETRYEFAQEWIDVVKRAWGDEDELDFHGRFFQLTGVRAKPKPFGGTRPIIMNAGSSGTGQAFALRNCDAFFTASGATRTSLEGDGKKGRGGEARGATMGPRRRGVHRRTGDLPPEPTRGRRLLSARQHRQRRLGRDRAHAGAAQHHAAEHAPEDYAAKRHYFAANAVGGYPFVGTPDRVADELATISRAGLRGIAVSFVNYLAELPYFCAEVLPRLARMGLRA